MDQDNYLNKFWAEIFQDDNWMNVQVICKNGTVRTNKCFAFIQGFNDLYAGTILSNMISLKRLGMHIKAML